jgi:hypothetical protein
MANEWLDTNRLYPKFADVINADEEATAADVLEACLILLAPILAQMTPRETGSYYYDLKHMSEHLRRHADDVAGHA